MKTLDDVLREFPKEILEKFDFSEAVYEGALTPVKNIRCPLHGFFKQYTSQLRKGAVSCPACAAEKRAAMKRLDPSLFIERAKKLHGTKYSFAKTSYVRMTEKVTVTCTDHGDFSISPIKLVFEGQGCPTCGSFSRGKRITDINPGAEAAKTSIAKHGARFVAAARKVHGEKYDYSDTVYAGARQKLRIKCPEHGDFEQAAGHHLRGQGCPSCNVRKSAPEEQVAAFLEQLTPVVRRNRTLIAPKELDIYLPEHRLAVEFCGMYWHSHGDRIDEKKNKLRHAEKHRLCAERGIRLITLYETEWSEHPRTVKRLLRNAIGRSRGRLMARKCRLAKPTTREARAFYEAYHPQGGAGHGEHYGLYHGDKLVACMRFTFGNNDRGHGAKVRQWTLSRYATRVPVAGAASRLFKAFVTEQNPPEVKSFSDNRLFGGGMYERLGFVLEEDVVPDYQVWSPKLGLRPKPHYQRRVLPKRLAEHGVDEPFDPATDRRTEAEMTYLMGARRIYDCGKKRWLWTAP